MSNYKKMTLDRYLASSLFDKLKFRWDHWRYGRQLLKGIRQYKKEASPENVDFYKQFESILERSNKKGITLEENEALIVEAKKLQKKIKQTNEAKSCTKK